MRDAKRLANPAVMTGTAVKKTDTHGHTLITHGHTLILACQKETELSVVLSCFEGDARVSVCLMSVGVRRECVRACVRA